MKVMIPGVDGYLGWPLALHLLAQGHDVIGIDNLSRRRRVREVGGQSATPIYSPFERFIALYEEYPRFAWRLMDLRDYTEVDYAFEKHRPDAVIHLGEIPSAPYSMIDVEHCNETQTNNIIGTNNILFAMHKYVPESHLIKLGCYDSDTEVLTEDGWKFFTKLNYDDKVCTLNQETEEISFEHPDHIVHYPYKGKMLEIQSRSIDLLITPNHRVVYREKLDGPLKICDADKLPNKKIYIPRGGIWKGKEQETFSLPSCTVRSFFGKLINKSARIYPMDNWLRFFGWHITEGSIGYSRSHSEPVRVHIPQKKQDNQKLIRSAINALGLSATESVRPDIIEFEIADNQLAEYLSLFGTSKLKYIPKELKQLNKHKLSILYDSMMRGDGHSQKGRYKQYWTASETLIGDMQEIALKLGCAGTMGVQFHKSGSINFWMTHSINTNDCVNPERRNWVNYDGMVHCCTVPSGIIYVRRHGKVCWSGNTMGEYGTPDMDIPEGEFEITYRGRTDTLIFPRQPGSYYHLSKVHDTHNIIFACKTWGLRATDIMQGVVHGLSTPDMMRPCDCLEKTLDPRLVTRFDFDEIWGTALNRFCAQAVIGHNLTPYGTGKQIRGYIALRDSIKCMTIALEKPPKKGSYRTFNQFEECYSVNDLAQHVVDVSAEFDIQASIWNIENPRVESEDHYYNPDMKHLPDLGFVPTMSLDDELRITIPELMKHKARIEAKRDKIKPTVNWRT